MDKSGGGSSGGVQRKEDAGGGRVAASVGEGSKTSGPEPTVNSQRVFKKSSPNNKVTLYVSSRDLVVREEGVDSLQGVVLVDPDYVQDRKVYGQVTLTFRYGREDEEVMGLKFCNEAIMALGQLYPPHPHATPRTLTPLQEALLRRLGANAYAFTLHVTPLAPPSVQLVPAKEYNGAPIGTSYEMRAYVADRPDEKPHRRSSVRMGLRVVQRAPRRWRKVLGVDGALLPSVGENGEQGEGNAEGVPPGIHSKAEKAFLLRSEGRVELEAWLDRGVFAHGENINVRVAVRNRSSRTVRRIKVLVVQHVDVCMFSNGKFKNVVASERSSEGCPLHPGATLLKTYPLRPTRGATKNWIALQDTLGATAAGACLASTVEGDEDEDRNNVFAIYVSYYVKVKAVMGGAMGGALAVKLPFSLVQPEDDDEDEDDEDRQPEPSSSEDKAAGGTETPAVVPTEEGDGGGTSLT
ncbi:phosrestin-2-like [Hetaerina americana]|uniref:phosrestin-2-like n=1 Tax=Hetaerina americana TaxID=62018 RepID=UPI003A7F3D22